ncbi:GntR family transcriptional regulator [Candidatus Sulfopaludibacter sp. SbA3]|nr:GntR family transcriptional regulator [Candidatus Sulfopaludibacter sp. SbA3]
MQLLINPADELPIYRQIMRQITEAIAGGLLRSGAKLLSHRELSEQLVIAPLTVKKAYDELEALGFIETVRGRGTFVAAKLPLPNPGADLERLRQNARRLLAQAYLAGLTFDQVVELLQETHSQLTENHESQKENV